MSTDYAPVKKIPARDLFDGRLEEFGVREHVQPDITTETCKCLTDSRNFVWVYIDDTGFVSTLTRNAGNVPTKIFDAIAKVFDTDIASEHEPQFWGFATQKEWDAWQQTIADEHEKKFRIEVLKFLRGEANDIGPGTIGMLEAEIAVKLVAQDPELMMPQNEDKLFKMVRETYQRDHSVKVTLSEADMAFAKLVSTHEDELPKG